jgi:hypothetical protein
VVHDDAEKKIFRDPEILFEIAQLRNKAGKIETSPTSQPTPHQQTDQSPRKCPSILLPLHTLDSSPHFKSINIDKPSLQKRT